MTPATLPIAERFVSIQGEGVLTGVPSVFIRVSGCNLRCAWCDTPHASWAPEGGRVRVDELVRWVESTGVKHAVLTGGEPMMFVELCELSHRLSSSAGMHVTIETAGTIIPTPIDPAMPLACDLMSISPKLAGSTPSISDPRDLSGVWATRHEQRRLNIPILQSLLDTYLAPKRQLKFVVSSQADIEEIQRLLTSLTGWTPQDVLLMPEGTAHPPRALTDLIVKACITHGYRYCHRLHIELFGHTRGT